MSTISIFHSLGRSGGTIISRCLGSMETVILLSEIHPRGVELMSQAYGAPTSALFSPTIQAKCWHQLLDARLYDTDFKAPSPDEFLETIVNIYTDVSIQQKTLVIRDWSFLDFIGFPFCEPALKDSLSEILEQWFHLKHIYLIRHPVDQWISIKKVPAFKHLSIDSFLNGYLSFLSQCQGFPVFKYEDFISHPDETLQSMTHGLDVTYDPCWNEQWPSYIKVTGDEAAKRPETNQIRQSIRPPVEASFLNSINKLASYREILRLTGYQHPESTPQDLNSSIYVRHFPSRISS